MAIVREALRVRLRANNWGWDGAEYESESGHRLEIDEDGEVLLTDSNDDKTIAVFFPACPDGVIFAAALLANHQPIIEGNQS